MIKFLRIIIYYYIIINVSKIIVKINFPLIIIVNDYITYSFKDFNNLLNENSLIKLYSLYNA